MKYPRHLLATLSAVAVMSTGLGVSTAWSADDKVFPGVMCVRNHDFVGGTLFNDDSGRLYNSSGTSTLNVICPIVRDNTGSPSFSANVKVIDQHVSQAVSCRAISKSPDGNFEHITGLGSSSGNSSSGIPINLGSLAGIPNGYHYIRCSIPPLNAEYSAVASYQVTEQ